METLILAYLLVGCGVALVVWYASFDRDFDQYVRDYFREEPPTNREKWLTIILCPILWPYYLFRAFR